jgi:hypothetical protein
VGQQREEKSNSGDKGEALHFFRNFWHGYVGIKYPKGYGRVKYTRWIYAGERERARFFLRIIRRLCLDLEDHSGRRGSYIKGAIEIPPQWQAGRSRA